MHFHAPKSPGLCPVHYVTMTTSVITTALALGTGQEPAKRDFRVWPGLEQGSTV